MSRDAVLSRLGVARGLVVHAAGPIDEPFPAGCPEAPTDLGTCCWAWWVDELGVEHTAVRAAVPSWRPGARRRALARLLAVNQHHLEGIRHLATEGTDSTPLRAVFLRDANPRPAFLRPPVVVWSDVGERGRWEPDVLATAHDDLCRRLGLLTDLPWTQRADVRAGLWVSAVCASFYIAFIAVTSLLLGFDLDVWEDSFVALSLGLVLGLMTTAETRNGMRRPASRRF